MKLHSIVRISFDGRTIGFARAGGGVLAIKWVSLSLITAIFAATRNGFLALAVSRWCKVRLVRMGLISNCECTVGAFVPITCDWYKRPC